MTNFGHDLFWDVISGDQDAKAHTELVVRAKLAAHAYQPFLHAAASEADFEERLALVQPEIEHKVASIVTAAEYLDRLPEVRTEVLSGLQSDWSDLNSLRRTEAARRIEAALRIEANEHVVELPKQFVHIMASKAGPDESYEIAHVASPEFAKTLKITANQDEALATARQFTQAAPMPIYFNGRYVEGHLAPKAHDYFDAAQGRWVHVPAKTAYIDPDDARRYDRYPVGDAQVASGGSVLSPTPGPSAAGGQTTETSTGPDGFPADLAQGEQRSQMAYQYQTTPNPWTVTPGTEWREDTTPNAATGQVTPSKHGSRVEAGRLSDWWNAPPASPSNPEDAYHAGWASVMDKHSRTPQRGSDLQGPVPDELKPHFDRGVSEAQQRFQEKHGSRQTQANGIWNGLPDGNPHPTMPEPPNVNAHTRGIQGQGYNHGVMGQHDPHGLLHTLDGNSQQHYLYGWNQGMNERARVRHNEEWDEQGNMRMRTGSQRTASDGYDEGWERSTSDDFNGDRDRDQYKCPDCGTYNVVERARCKDCGEDRPKSVTRKYREGARHQAAGGGHYYDPSDAPSEYHYNEGYQHATNGVEYRGYGGRPAAISYGQGYRHGTWDQDQPFGGDYPPHWTGYAKTKHRKAQGSQHQAAEGVGPGQAQPGYNPNYFSQGTTGLTGPDAYSTDPTGTPPRPAPHQDDVYDTPDGGVSQGTGGSDGTVDGQGYSRTTAARKCMRAGCRKQASVSVPHQSLGSWDLCNEDLMQAIQLNPRTAAYALDDPRPLQWRRTAARQRQEPRPFAESAGERTAAAQVSVDRLDRDGSCVRCGGPADVMLRHNSDRDGTRNIGPACDRCAHTITTTSMVRTASEFLRVTPGASGDCSLCGNQATHQLHQANGSQMHQIGQVCQSHAQEMNERKLAVRRAAGNGEHVTCGRCKGLGTVGEDERETPCPSCDGVGWFPKSDYGHAPIEHTYPHYSARSAEHLKDYRIVGVCDNCHSPVRWHGDANELRHLHSNDNRCTGSNNATAKSSSLIKVETAGAAGAGGDANVPTPEAGAAAGGGADAAAPSNVPQTTPHTKHHQHMAVGVEQPTPENPTGRGADEFRARHWEDIVQQRPMQSADDRNVNTPTLPSAPIETMDTDGPRERHDQDENDAAERNERNAARRSIAELMEI